MGLVRATRRALIARRQQVTAGEEGLAAHAEEAVQGFRSARERVSAWPLAAQGFELCGPGLQSAYGKGRSAFTEAYREPADARFHEARKRVKYLWYQMRVLHNVWPEAMRAYRGALHNLSELLGDDHDLILLREILRERPETLRGARNLERMASLIERRQCQLKAEARILGMRIFAERPKAFRQRMGRYWRAWQMETDAAAAQPPPAELDTREVA
jgi:CHAD domain-containing protein